MSHLLVDGAGLTWILSVPLSVQNRWWELGRSSWSRWWNTENPSQPSPTQVHEKIGHPVQEMVNMVLSKESLGKGNINVAALPCYLLPVSWSLESDAAWSTPWTSWTTPSWTAGGSGSSRRASCSGGVAGPDPGPGPAQGEKSGILPFLLFCWKYPRRFIEEVLDAHSS